MNSLTLSLFVGAVGRHTGRKDWFPAIGTTETTVPRATRHQKRNKSLCLGPHDTQL